MTNTIANLWPYRLRRGRAEAWAYDEEHYASKNMINPDIALYCKDALSYREMIDHVRQNPRLPLLDPDDDGMDAFASCDGCGV